MDDLFGESSFTILKRAYPTEAEKVRGDADTTVGKILNSEETRDSTRRPADISQVEDGRA